MLTLAMEEVLDKSGSSDSPTEIVSGELVRWVRPEGERPPALEERTREQRLQFREGLIDYRKNLIRFAYSLTRHAEKAEDLVTETIIKALGYESKFWPGSNLRQWLFMIMKNHFISEKRRNWRQQEFIEGDAERIPVEADAHFKLEFKEALVAIQTLPRLQREAFEMVVLHGMTYEDTADILNVEVGTIKSRVSRGREILYHYFGISNQNSGNRE